MIPQNLFIAISITVDDLLNLLNICVNSLPLEHLGLALALNVPVFVVVTKIDMCPPNVLQDTMKLLARILKSPGCRKIPVIVQNTDDVVVSATNFVSERYVQELLSTLFLDILKYKLCIFHEIIGNQVDCLKLVSW